MSDSLDDVRFSSSNGTHGMRKLSGLSSPTSGSRVQCVDESLQLAMICWSHELATAQKVTALPFTELAIHSILTQYRHLEPEHDTDVIQNGFNFQLYS